MNGIDNLNYITSTSDSSGMVTITLTFTSETDPNIAQVQDVISRLSGVGDISLFGSQYAMRIWIDPVKLKSYNLTPNDVKTVVKSLFTASGFSFAGSGQNMGIGFVQLRDWDLRQRPDGKRCWPHRSNPCFL